MALVSDIEIRLRADIARLQQDMNKATGAVTTATGQMEKAAGAVRSAFAGLFAGLGAAGLVRFADEYTKFTAQIKLATQSQREYNQAVSEVKRVSNAAQVDLAAIGTLYARIAQSTSELGIGQRKVAEITETVALALKVSGATAQETASATLQLSQAFGSGVLRGEEFNAVNEAAPRLMRALAEGMGVPIGALRTMASEGKITSEVMANVLPKAMAQLQEEAKHVQTISGAFTVLKNSVMELVGVQANASGGVAVLTRSISALADNLGLVAGAIATLVAAKFAVWLAGVAQGAYNAVAANRVLALSALETAKANAVATGQAVALANARLNEARASTLAATGAVQLAVATNGLIPAQARATAAVAAHTAALNVLSVAQRAASISATAASTALAALGGPIGAVITVLGLAATAWAWYASKSKEANAETANAVEEGTSEVVRRIEEQNEKLRERIELGKQAGKTELAQQGGKDVERLAAMLKDINELKAKGNSLDAAGHVELITKQGLYNDLNRTLTTHRALQDQVNSGTRESGLAEWFGKNGSAAQRMAHELENLRKQFGTIPPEMEKLVRAKFETKAVKEVNAELTKQRDILAESAGLAANFAESWARLGVMYKTNKISLKELTDAQAKLLAKQPAIKARNEAQEEALKEEAEAAREAAEGYADYYDKLIATTASLREDAAVQKEQNARLGLTKRAVAELDAARLDALATVKEENAVLSANAVLSDNAMLGEDIVYQYRAQAAALRERADAVRAGAVTEETVESQKKIWESIDRTAHDTFVSIFDSGKNAFDRLRDTLKNGLYDFLYQMTVKKWLINISASVSGTGGLAGAANAATGGAAGAGGSAAGSALGGIAGGLFGAGGLTGALTAGAGWVAGTTTLSGALSAGASLIGTGTMAGAASGAAMLAGAVAPIALAIAAVYALVKKLDTSGTKHTGGASISDVSGLSAISAESLGMANIATSAQAQQMTGGIATGITSILNSTATAFGREAGYSAATAFADDTSKDGAWGALLIKNLSGTVVDWNASRTSRWAPREYADGEAGRNQYLAELSKSVRSALDGIGLPGWARTMLNDLGDAPALDDLAKVVDQVNAIQSSLKVLGGSIASFASLSDGAVTALANAAGGMDGLISGLSAFYEGYYTESEKLEQTSKQVKDALGAVGLAMPDTRAEFRAMVEQQMALGESGAKSAAALLSVSGAFGLVADAAAITTDLVDAAGALREQRSLEIQLMEAMGDAEGALAERRKDALASLLSDQARILQTQIWAAEQANAAITKARESAEAQRAAQQAINASFSSALADSMTRARDAAAALRSFNDSLLLGNLSALSPEQKYLMAKQQFESADAQGIQGAANALLQASREWFGSGAGFVDDFARVQARISGVAAQQEAYAASVPEFWRMAQQPGGYRAEIHKEAREPMPSQTEFAGANAARIEELLERLVAEAVADKPQRAAVAGENREGLETLAEAMNDLRADIARMA